ncbi:hypothetical protein [Pseudomonas sp. Z2-11]
MNAEWSDKSKNFNPTIFIKLILECTSLNSEGVLQYEGFRYFENKGMLRSMILFNGKEVISPKTEEDIFNSGFADFAKSHKSNHTNLKDSLLAAINKRLKAYLATPKTTFLVATSISTTGSLPIKKFTTSNIQTTFYPDGLPKKFKSRQLYDEKWKSTTPHTPSNYSGVVAQTLAHSADDAIHASIDEIDFIRGILSFFANPSMSLSLSGSPNKGINRIRLGGLHSVHNDHGDLTSENYWYEPDYESRIPFMFDPNNLKSIASNIRKIISRIEKLNGGEKIKDGIIRYVRALDESNKDYLIIKLWGAFEATVGQNDNSDIIIRRCTYLYKDQELVRQVLEVAKVYRNRSVHGNFSSSIADQIGYQLHSIFRHLIFFYVGSKYLASVPEANSFLDSPLATGDLERKIFFLKKAIRFRSSS